MIAAILLAPVEVAQHMAKAAKARRLSLNLSQQSLAERSGVSLGALKKFEQKAKISLESLLKLALTLDRLNDFVTLFKEESPQDFATLDELINQKQRSRGRK